MFRLLPVVVLVGFWVFCLIDCLVAPEQQIRNLPKWAWILIVLVFDIVGGIAWLVAGRPLRHQAPRNVAWPSTSTAGFPEYERPRRTQAPDDDPDFLRQIKASNDEHEQMLQRWERDLRKREEELRRKDNPDDPAEP